MLNAIAWGRTNIGALKVIERNIQCSIHWLFTELFRYLQIECYRRIIGSNHNALSRRCRCNRNLFVFLKARISPVRAFRFAEIANCHGILH